MKRLQLLLFAGVLCACGSALAEQPVSLGDRVVAFCKQHRGKRVGNGECSSLADAALRAAGARRHGWGDRVGRGGGGRGTDERGDDYQWGDFVCSVQREGTELKTTGQFRDIRPGDIIQYRDVELAGAGEDGPYTATARHHTAVVSAIQEDGMLRIYHQNFNGRRVVMADRLRAADLQQGRLSFYHPIPRTRRQPED